MSYFKVLSFAILIACAVFVGFVAGTNNDQHAITPDVNWHSDYSLSNGNEYIVKRIQVIEGHLFDVYLENGGRYLVSLYDVLNTPTEAKAVVIRELNNHKESGKILTLVPRSWDESKNCWVADIYLDQDHSLTNFLKSRQLVFIR